MKATQRLVSVASLASIVGVVGVGGTFASAAPNAPQHSGKGSPSASAPAASSSGTPDGAVPPPCSTLTSPSAPSPATSVVTNAVPSELAPFAAIAADEAVDRLRTKLHARTGAELLVRVAYAFEDPEAPVRFAPAPGSSNFATQPGGIYQGSEAPFRGGPITAVGVGYRFAPEVSVGLGGTFTQFLTSLTTGEGSSDLARTALGIAPYARVYSRLGPAFEIWGSAGAGYTSDTTSYDRMTPAGGTTAQGKWTMVYQALSLNAGVGIDWQPLSWLFLGPSLTYVGNIALHGCLTIDAPNLQRSWCTSDQNSVARAYSYQVLSPGISLRAAVF